MRKVYAYEYAFAVAQEVDRVTRLTIAKELISSRRTELEREIELETAAVAFCEAVSDVASPSAVAKYRSKAGVVAARKLILVAACGYSDGKHLTKKHWQAGGALREWLQQLLACFLDCLVGQIPDRLEHPIDKLFGFTLQLRDEFLSRWGMLMTRPQNLKALADALDGTPEERRLETVQRIFNAVIEQDQIPKADDFALIVKTCIQPKDGKEVN